jgi:hypothetical protein
VRRSPGRMHAIRTGRWVLAAVAVVAINALAGSAAMALKVAKQREPVAAKAVGAALAECPKGRTAVAGGFASPGFDPNGGPTIGRLGFKHAGRGGIETRGYNFGDATGDLASFAYCALHDHGFRVKSAHTQIEPGALGSAIAECPARTRAVGGGFDATRISGPDGPGVLTLTSKRQGERRWKVAGLNIPPDGGPGTAGTLTAYAYCEAAPFKLKTESREVTTSGFTTFEVRCPSGGRAFSGGFDGHVHLSTRPSGTAAVTSRRVSSGHAWRTSALSIFDSNPAQATAYAYCRR